ncbi:hypothetical protein ACFVV7_07660 [Streptomyces globisporus]|uniref:hypothetical protein n=1 Tax=Streptomyces globisporus TaxID=1908 RepID=UPI0036D93C13
MHDPSVAARPPRDVAVADGENPDTCPVRCWRAWREADALIAGPAFLPVDQKGCLGAQRLGPTAADSPPPGPPSALAWT